MSISFKNRHLEASLLSECRCQQLRASPLFRTSSSGPAVCRRGDATHACRFTKKRQKTSNSTGLKNHNDTTKTTVLTSPPRLSGSHFAKTRRYDQDPATERPHTASILTSNWAGRLSLATPRRLETRRKSPP